MEYAGEALRDASMAVELDPTYSKGYFWYLISSKWIDTIALQVPITTLETLKPLSRTSRNAYS